MSNEIRHKRSNVSGSKPALSLLLGELAINTADGVLFTKKNAGSDVMVEFHGSETAHLFKHQTSVPNPSSGYVRFYPKSDNNFYLRTSAGVERRLLTSDDSFWTASGNNIYNANAGSVGIGGVDTSYKFYVHGSIGARGSVNLVFQSQNNFASGLNVFKRGNSLDSEGAVASGSEFGYHGFYGWDGSSYARGAYAIAKAAEAWSTTAHGTDYYISITPNGSIVNSVVATFSNAGNFGIGTTTPTQKIDIPVGNIRLANGNIIMGNSKGIIDSNSNNQRVWVNSTIGVLFYTGSSSASERMRIDLNGNVGIGVTSPATQLHISGQLKNDVPTGTAPFVIASTTVNTNLNADLLDGYHASSFALSSHTHAYLPLSGGAMYNTSLVTNLNADLLDGQHASAFAPTSHNHSFAGLSDVALVSPSAGHTLVYNGSAWVNNSQIRSVPGAEYNTIYIRSAESGDDFGDSEMYMTAEEGIYFRTNIGKATAAEASFDRYGIRSSKLMGTGERYLAAGSDGLIKVATVQPTQYWQRDAGNYILSPIESYDEVHAWLFKAGGVLMSDGYLKTGRSGMYTVYNDMVVSEFYLSNNTFYYANSKLAFNNSTNLLTVDGGINAGSNLIAAGEVKLTKQTPGGVLRLQSHNAGPDFLRQHDYAGAVTFEAYNGSGYSGVATISARASQNHSGSGMGTNIEFWNYPNNGSNTRPAMILREDGILDNYFGFAVSGSDGKSGTATILTGCSYNSVTKTLIYTRASVTFSGGIVTNIASMSSLSVPLT